jgi:hypothetical protein
MVTPRRGVLQNMKDQFNVHAHVVLGKRKRTDKNTEEDDMWKKQSIFWELPYWKDLDICHSIDVMHVKKNVCESLLGALLNTDGKLGTMDMHELI